MKGQKAKPFFMTLLHPYDSAEAIRRAEETFSKVTIPAYLGTGWYAQSYKSHFLGAQNWFAALTGPKKLMITGMAQLDRPFRSFHSEIVRWYDHWLKGIDTGILDEAPIKVFVMGANRWRHATAWPLPETRWTKYYLDSWERLRIRPRSREPMVRLTAGCTVSSSTAALVRLPNSATWTKTRNASRSNSVTLPPELTNSVYQPCRRATATLRPARRNCTQRS